MHSGYLSAICLSLFFGIYLAMCFYLIVKSSQILSKRLKTSHVDYPTTAEAAFVMFPNKNLNKWAGCYRHFLDFIICVNLFGSCACYQLIIGKTIKQLVENTQLSEIEGHNGMPSLRVYVAAMIIPCVLICLITELKYLAPFSIVANVFVAICVVVTIYYGLANNPNFEGMTAVNGFYQQVQYVGIAVFSMSCAGVVVPVENNMQDPTKFPFVLIIGYVLIMTAVFLCSFFGYVGYLENCKSPITINFPMTLFPKILKGLIAAMIYVTHALNFYMPFNTVFTYIKKCHDPNRLYFWELFYRAAITIAIGLIAITFPSIDALMGLLGSFCIVNMGLLQPNLIYLLVTWHRPGLGKLKWRLWRCIIFSIIGLFVGVCGCYVSGIEMYNVLVKS